MSPNRTHTVILFADLLLTKRLAKVGVSLFFIGLLFSTSGRSQEIDFGTYSSLYSVSISEFSPGAPLDFGMVVQNSGLNSIDILNSKVLMIEGVRYLDVIIDITADNYLYLGTDIACNGSNTNCIPFTLQAAYANRGSNNPNQAVIMPVASNVASAQFPILARGNAPPGPPPTPVYQGFNPSLYNSTAYLYIYGSLNVGNVNAGPYTGSITITVSYD